MATAVVSRPTSIERSTSAKSQNHLSIHNIANIFIRMKRHKSNSQPEFINSGDESKTHEVLAEEDLSHIVQLPTQYDTFLCMDGVDTGVLLRASRASLLGAAEAIGGNALVNEKWNCHVSPRRSSKGLYKIQITYTAAAARVSGCRDPRKPVELGKAQKFGGLMTIRKRERDLTV